MGSKPLHQNHESKTTGVDYSRISWAQIMGPKPCVQNHEPKTIDVDYKSRDINLHLCNILFFFKLDNCQL